MSTKGGAYKDVTRATPCPICRKDTHCTLTQDDSGLVFCRRVGPQSEQRQDASGAAYWVHWTKGRTGRTFTPPELPATSAAALATVETRDEVYRALLQLLPLSPEHNQALQARGLSAEAISLSNYGTLPIRGRAAVAHELVKRFGPDKCATVPGIVVKDDGRGPYWTLAGAAGLLIPSRNRAGLIQAHKIRSDDPGEDYPRYSYLTSTKYDGPGPGGPVHVPLFTGSTHRVRVTEGELKAEIATHLSGVLTISVAGVSAWRGALPVLRELGAETVALAFDADCRENLAVANALLGTAETALSDGFTVELELWDPANGKGIDDLLSAGGTPELLKGQGLLPAIRGLAAGAQTHTAVRIQMPGVAERRVKSPSAVMETAQGVLKGLEERTKSDPGAVFEDETLQALAVVRDSDPQEWARVMGWMRKARVPLTALKENLPRTSQQANASPEADDGEQGPATAGQMLPGCPYPDMLVPPGYSLQEGRTVHVTEGKDQSPAFLTVADTPILLGCFLKDVDEGTESVRVAFWRRNRWQEETTPLGTLMSGRRLIDELAPKGFPAADTNVKPLVAYFLKAASINSAHLPCAKVSSHLAWQGPAGADGFLWGRELILPSGERSAPIDLERVNPNQWEAGRVSFRGASGGDEQIADGFAAAGDFGAWLNAVSVIQRYPRVLLAFYASLVPPLLEILKAPNFIVDLANRTSTGKTVSLQVAASIWGNPDPYSPASVQHAWNNSHVYVERASAVLSGLPLILDDTKQVRHPEHVAKVLYQVANGTGRGRGNVKGLARTRNFRTVLLSSGEAPATSFTQDGGTRARCLEVRGIPFGKDTERGTVDAVKLGVLTNYGHAGPEFVSYLLKRREKWGDIDRLYRKAIEHYASLSGDNVGGRMAQYFALIHTAGGLAHKALGLPWEWADAKPLLESLWESVAGEAADASGDVRALRDVMSWAYAHSSRFYGNHAMDFGGKTIAPPQGWAGSWKSADGWDEIAFLPTELDKILRENKYEPEAILAGWQERGWLKTDGRNRGRKRELKDSNPRMIVITKAAVEEVEA